ncbi:MAG: 5'-nucleotidase C-terminal domain-containing protein [Nannocystaceae bacterium]
MPAPRSTACLVAALALGLGCRPEPPAPPVRAAATITISIVGTNDLHGHVGALPLLGGYLANLRRARAHDGGVVLLDGGDMYQGTLESNLDEGAPVVAAYDALGYDAVAIGNHEFDYGPVGPEATANTPDEDPLGALRARIAQARHRFLSANLHAAPGAGEPRLGARSTLIERGGVTLGIIGASTTSTPRTTIAANVRALSFAPLADAIAAEARALRQQGAAAVIVTAHAGGDCSDLDHADALDSCDPAEEIMAVAAALPPGLVDVIVGGHTHQAMAHRVHGIAVIESYALGVAFGRVDLTIDGSTRKVVASAIHPPQRLCSAEGANPEDPLERCAPRAYEGAAVQPDAAVAAVVAPAIERARVIRERRLGPTLSARFEAERDRECALGNLFADLMLAARPGADAAIMNGGGLRAPLPAGPLHYGALYEAFPFDNRFAIVRLPAATLAQGLAHHLARDGSFFSLAGIVATTRCERGTLVVSLARRDGTAIADDERLAIVTTDFLATGGDGLFGPPAAEVAVERGPPIREVMAEALAGMGARTLTPQRYFDAANARVRPAGARAIRCAASSD